VILRTCIPALLLAGLALGAAPAQTPRNPECARLDSAQRAIVALQLSIDTVTVQGRAVRQGCDSLAGGMRDRCLDRLKPMRARIKSLREGTMPLREEIDRLSAACNECCGPGPDPYALLLRAVKESCDSGSKPDRNRCDAALSDLAELEFQRDRRHNLVVRETYERRLANWQEDRDGEEPKPGVVSYAKGLAANLRYLEAMPEGMKRDVSLFRTAQIYDSMGRAQEAFPLLEEIVARYPGSRHFPHAVERIGEAFFARGQDDSALAYYGRLDLEALDQQGLGKLLYHKGEALRRTGKHSQAVEAFLQSMDRSDWGQTTGECRQGALLGMGASLAELPDAHRDARTFFRRIGGRSYQDTVLFEIGDVLRTRGKVQESRKVLEDLIHDFPRSKLADRARALLAERP